MWLFGDSPKKIVSKLSSTNVEERRKASQKLKDMAKKKPQDLITYLPEIVPKIADPDPVVRMNVIEALINLAQANPGTALSTALPLLQNLLTSGSSSGNLVANIIRLLLGG